MPPWKPEPGVQPASQGPGTSNRMTHWKPGGSRAVCHVATSSPIEPAPFPASPSGPASSAKQAPSVPKLTCPSLCQGTGVGGFGSSLWERASECQPPGSRVHPPSLLAVARGVGRVGQHHLEEEIE